MFSNIAPDRRAQICPRDRRVQRIVLPDCPSCQSPLHVDVRSADTLYARCQRCGHRRMIAKPIVPSRL